MTAALLLFTAGCGKTDLTESKINGDEQKTIESREMEETTEKGENFFNLYYYSPLIRENVTIGGKKVNLHVSFNLKSGNLSETEYVTVSSPVNYGGY